MESMNRIVIFILFSAVLYGCGDEKQIEVQVSGLSGEMEITDLNTWESFVLSAATNKRVIGAGKAATSLQISKAPLMQTCEFTANKSTRIYDVGRGGSVLINCYDKVLFGASVLGGLSPLYLTDGTSENTVALEMEDSRFLAGQLFDKYKWGAWYDGPYYRAQFTELVEKNILQKIDNYYVYQDQSKQWKTIDYVTGETSILDYFPNTIQLLNLPRGLFSLRTASGQTTEIWKHPSLFAPPVLEAKLEGGDFTSMNLFEGRLIAIRESGYIVEVSNKRGKQEPLPGRVIYTDPASDIIIYFSNARRKYNGEYTEFSLFQSLGSIFNVERIHASVEGGEYPVVLGEVDGSLVFNIRYRAESEYCNGVFLLKARQLSLFRSSCDQPFESVDVIDHRLRFITVSEMSRYERQLKITYLSELSSLKEEVVFGPVLNEGENFLELAYNSHHYFWMTHSSAMSQHLAPFYHESMVRLRARPIESEDWALLVEKPGAFCRFNCQLDPPVKPMGFVGNKLVFSLYTEESGKEPWVTDGTIDGTYMLQDLNPLGGSLDTF
ncbi:MAG: hypothetical protein H7A01_01415 [Hahellaceae bacterium]|nr:hypothetical protein [Hahellaceae bacterium]